MKKTMWMILAAVICTCAVVSTAEAASSKQTATQALRSQSASANGTKRSFEIDLSKYAPKDATSQRTAQKAQRHLRNASSKKGRQIKGRKRVSRDQKNFGALNR